VMLSSSVSSSKDHADKKIEGRVMQEVSAPSGLVIKEIANRGSHD